MLKWSDKIKSDPTSLSDAIAFYYGEYEKSKKDIQISMFKLEREKLGTSHIFEHRLSQLQDIESMLKILNTRESNLRRSLYKKLIEDSPKANIDYLINLDDNVKLLEIATNELALIRNLYLGILKGLHVKSSSVNLCSKLHKEDTIIIIDY